jgi:hypothetical protein
MPLWASQRSSAQRGMACVAPYRSIPTPSSCLPACPPATSFPAASFPARDTPPLTVAALHIKTVVNPATSANEIVAASVVHLRSVSTDGPMSQEEWNTPRALRHFSAVRKLDGQTFPTGATWVGGWAWMGGRWDGGCLRCSRFTPTREWGEALRPWASALLGQPSITSS